MPKRIQRKRNRGFCLPLGCVYVGRPTKWGNPFRVGSRCAIGVMGMTWSETITNDPRYTKIQDRAMAVEWFRRLIALNPFKESALAQLRGKDLACWCPLTDKDGNLVPCHADVLLEIANA